MRRGRAAKRLDIQSVGSACKRLGRAYAFGDGPFNVPENIVDSGSEADEIWGDAIASRFQRPNIFSEILNALGLPSAGKSAGSRAVCKHPAYKICHLASKIRRLIEAASNIFQSLRKYSQMNKSCGANSDRRLRR
jgi:hypothetical protein